jgi:hypothetical protein
MVHWHIFNTREVIRASFTQLFSQAVADLQLMLLCICTCGVQVGWHVTKPHQADLGERFTLPHTDVTKKEGRTHATYYGYMTLL